MKQLFLYLFLCSFSTAASTQDCAAMFDYLKVGVTLEYTNFNKKGKLETVNTQKVTEVAHAGDTLVTTFALSMVDEKGKELLQNKFPMKCLAGTVYMDMSASMPQQPNARKTPDMHMEMSGDYQVFPADMKVGQTLPDAEMDMKFSMGSMEVMSIHYAFKNRKVAAEETITTTAGTFKCLKITYDAEYKLMGTRTNSVACWYAPAVGMVKSINYDKNGQEENRMELTKVTK